MGLFNLKGNPSKLASGSKSYPQSDAGQESAEQQPSRAPAVVPAPAPAYSVPAKPAASSQLSQSMTREDPPPYHDWTVIPDTSTLPPPPAMGYGEPFRNNAPRTEADRAHDWCHANPLLYPHQPSPTQIAASHEGHMGLMRPQEYKGDIASPRLGYWRGSTKKGMTDACLLTSLPLYYASADSPVHTRRNKVIYFEVEILSMGIVGGNDDSTLAIGYCALPWPSWRLPGWERASLGVHSDDGHRYINDTWGGKDFTAPFKSGDTIGIGMSFSLPESPPEYSANAAPKRIQSSVEVFLTRNGKKDSSWNLHEELDKNRDQPIDGLDGLFDLYGAVGVFGIVDFAVKFRREEWLWRPQ